MPAKTVPLTHEEVAGRLRAAVNRLQRRLRQESLGGLSPAQASALGSVNRQGSPTLGELAAIEQVQPPTMTRIVASLAEAGMVTRVVDATDRRSARVRITPAGVRARWSGCGRARTPSCCADSPSWVPMNNSAQPSWWICSSTSWKSGEAPRARGRAQDLPRHLGPQLSPLLHRAGDLGVRHLDADGVAGLPHPLPAARHRCRCRDRHQSAVPAAVAARAVRGPDRRPARQAQGPLRHPGDGRDSR